MVRSVTKKYQVWLAGYYDDFNGARAIPDDRNQPTDSSYSVLKSHFGNPMNGEAFINPRFRFSVEERTQDSAKKVASTSNQYLQNDGIFEWLTWDDIRLSYDDWEGRVQLQYPDGHVANRYKFDNDATYGTDFYQRFINGHNSDASYIVPTGDNDATHGHSDMQRYDITNYGAATAGKHSTTGNFVQRAHLTGVWMGEKLDYDWTSYEPDALYQEIYSPSKQPFLCIQTVRKTDTDSASTPSIIYDGHLNSRTDGDIFTARVALQSGLTAGAWADVGIRFEVGFPIAEAGICNDDGYSGTPAIDFTLDLDAISYDTQALLGGGSYDTPQVTIDNAWLDVDFVIDYTNNKFKAYYNGTEITSTNSTAGSYSSGYTMSGGSATTASNLYGYQFSVTNEGSSATAGYVSYLMIDRVGLVRYITDDFTVSNDAKITKMSVLQSVNGLSSCNIKIADDPKLTSGTRGGVSTDYILNLKNLFVASSPLDWSLLIFADKTNRIDRPVWRGEIDSFSINQNERSRILTVGAVDSFSALDRQMPLWDVGQKGENTSEDTTDYWSYDAQGFRDAMYMGGGKLKLLGNDVGFDIDSSHLESSTQRTQLGSGHPIQMYNNEDTVFGPNDIEDDYESFGIVGFTEESGSTDYTIAIADAGTHNITTSTSVNVVSGRHNATGITPQNVSGSEIRFNAADLAYNPESSKIVYIGKYQSYASYTHDYFDDSNYFLRNLWNQILSSHPSTNDATNSYMNVYFSTDPSLNVGDFFYINKRNDAESADLNTNYRTRHRVKRVFKIRSYFDSIGTGTGNSLWVVHTNTPYASAEHGDYPNDSLLTGTGRFSWSKDVGYFEDVFGSNATTLKHRAVHALWMRDLPNSLWFKYHYGIVKQDPSNKSVQGTSYISDSQTINSSSSFIQISQTAYDNAPNSGIAEIWSSAILSSGTPEVYLGKFIFQGKTTAGGNYYLIGPKYINFSVTTSSSSSHIVKFQDISSDYKHLWLLWSDMRNNGDANADGSERKTEFGLHYPISKNYEFDMFYVDQVDSDGELDKFASLKVGDDIDVWDIDSTTDPITGIGLSKPADYTTAHAATLGESGGGKLTITVSSTSSFGDYVHLVGSASHDGGHTISSKTSTVITTTTTHTSSTANTGGAVVYPTTGSEAESAVNTYPDWEDKAGALLVIDASKFFNLNTHINSGKTGQNSGGSTDLTDYVATKHGFPSLIDNYWAEATSSYTTTNLDGVKHHPAQTRLLSDVTLATDGFIDGYIGLPVNDISIFQDTGAGRLIAVMDRNEPPNECFFTWDGRLTTAYSSSSGINAVVTPGSSNLYEGQTIVSISNTGETHAASGITKGMVLKRTPSGGGTETIHNILAVGKYDSSEADDLDTSGTLTATDLVIQKNAVDGTTVAWGTGDTYTIPIQLSMVYMVSLNSIPDNASVTASEGLSSLEDAIWEHFDNQQESWDIYGINMGLSTTEGDENTPESSEVHSTVYSNYMLRLMMHMNGFYKSKNGGTYWESDKLRMLWNAAIMDTWLPSTRVNCIFDINNIPISNLMTTYNDTSSNDSYGSITDIRNKTLGSAIKAIQENSGYGDSNGLYTTFSYLIGKDNRLEFRPKYNSGIAFTRDNLSISNLNIGLTGQVTNVRVYFNNAEAFVDWPSTNLTDTTRWKIIERPEIISGIEARFIAQQEYNKYKNNPLSLKVKPMLESGVDYKMIDSGRYGYIADPYIALFSVNTLTNGTDASSDITASCINWTMLGHGGALFPGMVNALDGNMNVDIDPLKDRYGSSTEVAAGGYNLNTGGSAIGWDSNYYWYGSNSISNAVQIVHIPNSTPLVSDATGEHLRMWVDLKSGQSGTDIDNAEFTIYLSDYSFSGIKKVATLNNQTTKNVKHSGYYEIAFPSNYGAATNAKIVFSFNAEYCRALLRHRCGNPGASSILTSSQYNTSTTPTVNSDGSNCFDGNINSIFPLGHRYYPEMGGGFRGSFKVSSSAVSQQEGRMAWYSPRVQICRDLSYVPATYVTVTDAALELSSETMVIQDVKWDVAAGKTEEVSLTLERDESLSAGGIVSYLFPKQSGIQTGSEIGSGSTIVSQRTSRVSPPANSASSITDPSGQSPSGSTTDSTGTVYENSDGNSINTMTSTAFGRMKGRMNLNSDSLSGNSNFSVLGQEKPSVAPSTMKGIEGMDVDITTASGSASITADGYVFGGKGLLGVGDCTTSSQEQTVQTSFVVPTDVISNRLNIEARVTHSPVIADNKIAILYVTATVLETNETFTNTVRLGTGINKKRISLLPTRPLRGLKQAGNNIEIKITRKPGIGNDDADTTSVTIHNLDVKMERASAHTRPKSSYFSPSS
tara:strand:- start:285 stop:7289 length:7005 start_codon:yes stop_codon:yes gene_type:complete